MKIILRNDIKKKERPTNSHIGPACAHSRPN